ncbi:MAG: hypothetical protein M3N02_08855, partial [Pseudomonadota bacterium]|nr:hypothetical protein [Pseudomonadota bacterium]
YNVYVYGELGYAAANSPFLIHTHLGHTAGGLDFANKSYLDYTVGASYKWKALLFDLLLVGTDLSRNDTLPLGTDYRRASKAAVVASVSASF